MHTYHIPTPNLQKSLWFRSEQFDHTSNLPPDRNVGNQCYGEDLAQYLCDAFKASGMPAIYIDEDWGWLVMTEVGDNARMEVAIYNLDDKGEPSESGAPYWGLVYSAHEQRLVWGLLPWSTPVPVPSAAEGLLLQTVHALDNNFSAWLQTPAGDAQADNPEPSQP